MDLIFREARVQDAEQLSVINRDALGYDYSPALTENKLRKLTESHTDKIFVAVADGLVVGYIHSADYDVIYADRMKNIMGLAVLSEYRKCGIGRALLEKAEKWARETNAVGIRLCSGSQRTDAHKFYEHCGYVISKEQKNFKKIF